MSVNQSVVAVHRLLAGEELEDRLEGLLHHVPLPGDLDAHHEGVGRQRAGAHAEHHAAPGEVVEQHHPVGQHQRLVVGERAHPGAEPEVLACAAAAAAMNTSGWR